MFMENNAEKMHNVGLTTAVTLYDSSSAFSNHMPQHYVALCQRSVALQEHPGVLLIGRINGLLFRCWRVQMENQICGEEPQSLVLVMRDVDQRPIPVRSRVFVCLLLECTNYSD